MAISESAREPMDASKLRLALFTDTYAPQINGVARTLDRLSAAIHERGGAVRVFTPSDPESPPLEHVVRFPSTPFWAYKQLRLAWPSMREVREQVRNFRPTIVHVATPFGIGLAGRRVARETGVPIVSSYHTSFSAYSRHYKLGILANPMWQFLRWFHNSTQKTYCPSQAIADELNQHAFTNTAIWSRGVDATQFSASFRSAALRSSMGADDDTLVVTYVGRLAAEKGLDVAAAAVRLAAARRPGRIVFLCVGDGPYENEVRRISPDGSWLPGKLTGSRLSEAYASGDVFLFPSITDTFGNVIVEAMASGLPVIGADFGATRELVGSDRGWLVEPGNVEGFAQILVDLVDNPSLRVR
ncbi:MAG: glycosyltransferase family 1 protein, partial [Gemmatimonadaceae bacterium]